MSEDSDFAEDEAAPGLDQYTVVDARRQQWDNLLWQTPTMALTGEAFLLTISLARSTSQMGRIGSLSSPTPNGFETTNGYTVLHRFTGSPGENDAPT
ncbi:MAG: hypothetical protein HIU84_00720 [Acidobacteria bacterium]|nr:hypothetical protein [Acidobacteriota bacterium]